MTAKWTGPYVHPLEMDDAQFEEWLRKIRRGIGGYQIATLMGVGDGSLYEIWAKFMDLGEPMDATPAMMRGVDLEDDALAVFQRSTGLQLRVPPREHQFIRSPSNKFFVGQVDAYALPDGVHVPTDWGEGVVDAKVPASYYFGGWSKDGVPEAVWLQVTWYMGHLGLRWATVAALDYENWRTLGSDTPPIIEFDPEAYGSMVERAEEFLNQYIYTRTPPPDDQRPDKHSIQVPKIGNEEVRVTDPEHLALLTRFFEVRAERVLNERMEQRYRERIEAIFDEYDTAVLVLDDRRKIVWRPGTRRTIDNAKVLDFLRRKGEDPANYYKVSATRPFKPIAKGDG